MRGRIVTVAGRKVELVPHRRRGLPWWDAYFPGMDGEDECLSIGHYFPTRRDLVAWLRTPAGEAIVRQT